MIKLETEAALKGVSKLVLMENAGKAVADFLDKKNVDGKRILIVCGKGNNGGDGFVAARYLANKADVEILFLGERKKLKKEGLENFQKLQEIDSLQFIALDFVNFDDYDIIIDAMLGTGVIGSLKPSFVAVIDEINKSKAYKVSIDIPTGVNPDTGDLSDVYVNPDIIITFHDIKTGLKDFLDKVKIVDIGIPK